MITVKCPECSAGLQVAFKDQEFRGWKACKVCGVPSFVVIDSQQKHSAKSLHSMIQECKEKKMVAEALYYIMNKGEAYADDLYFNIGKKVESDLNALMNYHVIKKAGVRLEISKGLEPFIMKEIKPYLPKNNESFLTELDI
ncbi:MAG: hypothetical protein QXO69_02250 [archaeon]